MNATQRNPQYNEPRFGACVWNLAADDVASLAPPLAAASVDIATTIFALSAIDPARLSIAFANLFRLLKPGGKLLLRDYGACNLH